MHYLGQKNDSKQLGTVLRAETVQMCIFMCKRGIVGFFLDQKVVKIGNDVISYEIMQEIGFF